MSKKEESKPNPFYRGHEKRYDAGDKQIMSPVGSVFSHDYLHKGPNAMEVALKEQLDGPSRKVVSRGAK